VVVLKSGVHATLAGVALALTIPLGLTPGAPDHPGDSPLHTLEHALHKPVAFFVIPVFGFANAGVALGGLSAATLLQPLTLGIVLGLVAGKLVGVFGTAWLAVRLGLADMPANASIRHLLGVALLCGIGFTMSLFIGLLAFPIEPAMQGALKVGILSGSLISGLLGAAVLLLSPPPGGPDSH
jgi:NhaA family Na+:H+ antiporter